MNKTSLFIIVLLFGFFLFPKYCFSQFINIQINIEPELSTTVVKNLDFGTLVTNSGEVDINLGDLNMGVFNIKAIYTQSLYISMITPQALRHINPAITDQIPIELQIAFNNSGTSNPNNSTLLENNSGYIPIDPENASQRNRNQVWKEIYLYVFGSLYLEDISNGDYIGEILLSIDYD